MPGWASRVGWLFVLAYASGLVATRVHLVRLGVPHLGTGELLDVESVLIGSFAIVVVLTVMNLFRTVMHVVPRRLYRVADDIALAGAAFYVVQGSLLSAVRVVGILVGAILVVRFVLRALRRSPTTEVRDPVERLIDTILLRAETERQGAVRVAIVSLVTLMTALLVQPTMPLALGGGRPVPVVIELVPGWAETEATRVPGRQRTYLVADTGDFLVL